MENLLINDFNGYKIYTFIWNKKPCWIASQIALSFGYDNTAEVIDQCIDEEELEIGIEYEILKGETLEAFKKSLNELTNAMLVTQNTKYLIVLYEDGLYGFMQYSDKPIGTRFRKWLRREIIPQIMLTEEYQLNSTKEKIIKMKNNIELTLPEFEEKNVDPKYMILIWQHLYRLAGLKLPFLEEITIDKKLYEAQQIARQIGIFSKEKKPHSQAIKVILDKIGIEEFEKENVPFIQHGHIDTTTKYSETVIPRIEKWIIENNYPSIITKDKGTLNVVYGEKKKNREKKKEQNLCGQLSLLESI